MVKYPCGPVRCKPFSGMLSVRACTLNLEAAIRAYDMLESGVSVFIIDNLELDRLIGCSRCHLFPPDKPHTKRLLYNATRELAKKVAEWDEWGPDPEIMRARRRARAARYRDRHREEIKMAKRLAHLRQQHKKLMEGK